MYIFIIVYEVMEFLKNGHAKSWKSHGISFPDLCGNPVLSPERQSPNCLMEVSERQSPNCLMEASERQSSNCLMEASERQSPSCRMIYVIAEAIDRVILSILQFQLLLTG